MSKKHVTIIDGSGCKITGDFTENEIQKFEEKGWQIKDEN